MFTASDFTSEYSDLGGDGLASIRLVQAPVNGALLLGDVLLTAGYPLTLSEISAGLLRYVPAKNAFGSGIDSFDFVAVDVTAEASLSPTIFTFDVTAVNDTPTFSRGDGIVSTPIGQGASDDIAQSVAVQADGRIVVAGYTVKSETDSDLAVVRYNADGILDASFSGDGQVTSSIGSSGDYIEAATIQPDGRIVVAGCTVKSETNSDFAVVRYSVDGSIDGSFSGDGIVTTSFGPFTDRARSVVFQADGKIVVAGSMVKNAEGTDSDFAVARYNAEGTLDKNFSGDGKATASLGLFTDHAWSVIVQSDGKIVIAGSTDKNLAGTDSDFALVRYNTDGTLDKSFSGDGKVTTSFGSLTDYAYSVALQPDGKIVMAGCTFESHTESDFAVARYNADGTLDTNFSGDGMVAMPVGSSGGIAYHVTIQRDGKILAAGFAKNGSAWDIALVRYDSSGALDMTFDGDGMVMTSVGITCHDGLGMAVQPDGKIVVTASVWNGNDNDFLVLRYSADGTLDAGFDPHDTLGGTVCYTEGDGPGVTGPPVALDSDVQIYDVEHEAAGSYDNATLSLFRHDGANADDCFVASETLGALTESADLTIGGTAIGKVASNSHGILQLEFGPAATGALVNQAMRSIAYVNASDAPPSEVVIDWHFSDGAHTDFQGVSGITTVTILATNDVPSGAVSLEGVPLQGTILHVNTASLSDADGLGLLHYQWYRGERAIAGADGASYVLTADDAGHSITAHVFWTDGFGTHEEVVSGNLLYPGSMNADSVRGGAGNDVLYGNDGDDTFSGGAGNDSISGGDGHDTVTFSGSIDHYTIGLHDMVYTIFDNTGAEGLDSISGVELFCFAGITKTFSEINALVDSKAPAVIGFRPVDGSSGVSIHSIVEMTFNEDIQLGHGAIELHRDSADGQIIGSVVTVSGSTLTIHPEEILSFETSFVVTIGDGAVLDLAGNAYSGSESYEFQTEAPKYSYSGNVTFWKSNLPIPGAELSISGDVIAETNTVTDLDGNYFYDALDKGDYALHASKPAGVADASAVGFSDALVSLKIALGRSENSESQAVSSCQFLAADVDKDGKVEVADAFEILKMAVKQSSSSTTEWTFMSDSVEAEMMTKDSVSWPDAGSALTLDQNMSVHLVGVLMGDVDGSWTPHFC